MITLSKLYIYVCLDNYITGKTKIASNFKRPLLNKVNFYFNLIYSHILDFICLPLPLHLF